MDDCQRIGEERAGVASHPPGVDVGAKERFQILMHRQCFLTNQPIVTIEAIPEIA
jgi:hypothetical protein